MRIFATLTLLGLLAGTATANTLDRKPRRKRSTKTEQTTPQPAQESRPAAPAPAEPEPEDSSLAKRTPRTWCDTTASRDLTPQQIDSLAAVWQEQRRLEAFESFFREFVADVPAGEEAPGDSLYVERLRALASPIELPFNAIVKGYINRYTSSQYGTMSRILAMSRYYFPLIEDELLREGLPIELRALPIIESALSTTAVSPMGAVGLWQFMPTTGKSYGLEVNSLVDARRDPLLATRAACRYLKDLYNIYHDWTLAIAAYNCGPGNVNKALARAGGGTTFWDIYEYLPRETRGYVPAFVGASYAYAYHQQHGIQSENPPMPLATDTIRVTRLLHLGQVASTLDIPIETLRTLNPQYKMDIIPATIKSYTLVLPQHYLCQYIASEEEIHRKDSTYLKEYINPANIEKKKLADATPAYTTYTVKRGDTLGAIARRYRTTTAQIMKLNKLKNANKLREGQRLRIPIRR